MEFTKEVVAKQLKESVCKVIFTKTDGTERVMKCTLKEDVLKPYIEEIEKRNAQMLAEGKVVKAKAENPNLLSVIDLENNGWRSFKIDSIKSVEVVE
jgi:hypothetical protein